MSDIALFFGICGGVLGLVATAYWRGYTRGHRDGYGEGRIVAQLRAPVCSGNSNMREHSWSPGHEYCHTCGMSWQYFRSTRVICE